ncbi:putative phage terminase large subunit-like protein [Dysgonomonas sp. PFB1-18]|uniref:phage terminase large subunit family protein n=1 Tax=unclassified Dysgonomonas TaxID=2630389 RepID=UPI0024744E0A|nr:MULTISPECIES: heat-shock protein Hsp70 [unclassified Dysgonomonas]MDH6308100.1 putative phage terminase large subunit-like protein [Dysgonomonas sp. PF1-14]MDH6339639.1 putative phage terminase large subunit-like protein [Dysgonomonas sp. PF1-16]MDH6381290.1 putative phage terminase large subunit-like protein [Dysgonomonas sp. PFB1-18]MDH6398502.1 putative phage terminase large subunit-like protein [Dysgonomonas sp. PF1-23]
MCKKRFYHFVEAFWSIIIPEEPVFNWHIEYLCDELQELAYYIINRLPKPYDLIINIPPGTTKSTIVTIMFPAWLWTVDARLRVISSSYSSDVSLDHAQKSKDIITSDKYQRLFPEVQIRRDKSGKGFYGNISGGERYVTSTGSAVTGKHAHVIINDDPQNPKQAESDVMRLQATEFTKTLSTRKVNKKNTPTITIMQRLHEDDVTGYLLKKKGEKIKHICLPAELSEHVKPVELREKYVDGLLDPVRLDKEVIEEARTDLGTRGFAGQYEQTPASDKGNIIKKEWFGHISLAQFLAVRGGAPMHFFIDTAYDEKKKKTDNDPSGILAACKIGNQLFIYHAQKVWKEFPDLIRFLPEYCDAWGYDGRSTLRIEPKANGKSVVQQLRDSTDLNVTETPTPIDSKATRLKTASPKVECGRVILVDGDWNEDFVEEICKFPSMTHDEYVDILYYAIEYFLLNDLTLPEGISKSSFGGLL